MPWSNPRKLVEGEVGNAYKVGIANLYCRMAPNDESETGEGCSSTRGKDFMYTERKVRDFDFYYYLVVGVILVAPFLVWVGSLLIGWLIRNA